MAQTLTTQKTLADLWDKIVFEYKWKMKIVSDKGNKSEFRVIILSDGSQNS